jgi:hypothetical protein
VSVDEKYGFVRGEDSAGSMVNVRDGARFVNVAGTCWNVRCGAGVAQSP